MCSTEMSEAAAYTMSPGAATASSSANPGACGLVRSPQRPVASAATSRSCSSPQPPQPQPTSSRTNNDLDDDEISVGCPSPLPLVVGSSQHKSSAPRQRSVSPCRVSSYQGDDEDERCSRDEEYTRDREQRRIRSLGSSRRHSSAELSGLREMEDEDDIDDDDDDEAVADEEQRRARGNGADDYFKPLKRLKMVQVAQSEDEEESRERESSASERGVKSFSIIDILSHRPKAKIVRPWDTEEQNHRHENSHPSNHPHGLHQHHSVTAHFGHGGPRDLSIMGMSLASMSGSISEPPLSSSSSSGRSSVSDSGSPDPLVHHHHHHHHQHHSLHSGMHHSSMQQQQQQHHHHQLKRKSSHQHGSQSGPNGKRTPSQGGGPLDALFQMTSKTFDAGEHSQEQANHLHLFNNRQQPKKKRKSRTAFTNQQIFELEKRFLYQKYLSPADRDEIAAQLGLSNAQVITWFQNRRAKLKRDMEELKKDVQTVNPLLVAQHHKTFLENVQDLGILKKRPLPNSIDEKS
ncbi:hypothetical protein TKK_0005480 [Trichogramma kaykai]|uniref:Homeobox domain-containing protein n=1 Tax=Trichogramma kaykai TaxID=54128 RepID=A0ABD2XH37_9HYME